MPDFPDEENEKIRRQDERRSGKLLQKTPDPVAAQAFLFFPNVPCYTEAHRLPLVPPALCPLFLPGFSGRPLCFWRF